MKRCKGVLLAGMLVLSMSVPVYADKSVVVKVEAPADTTDYYMTVDSGGVGVDIYPSTDGKGEKLNDKTVRDGTVLHIEGETEKNGETWGYTKYNGRYGYVPLEELLLWPPVAAVAVGEIWVRVPEISPSVASLVMRAFMPMDTLGTSYS